MKQAERAYVLSVSAGKGCYRHIRISGDMTLEQLNEVILEAFEFVNDHAHAFFMDNRAWSDTDSYYMAFEDEDDDKRHTCDITLDQLHLKPDTKFLYIFDFGDEWLFQCKVLRVLEELSDEPCVILSKGDPPVQYSGAF